MTVQPRKLDDTLSVYPQISPEDVAEIAALGFKAIINNRPDNEEWGQPSSDDVAAAAAEAGLAYTYIPITPGQFTPDVLAAQAKAIAEMPGPIFAFCRTGTRCATLWSAMNASELGVDGVIEVAAGAGYDLAQARPLFQHYSS